MAGAILKILSWHNLDVYFFSVVKVIFMKEGVFMKEFSRPVAEVVELGDGVFTAGSDSYGYRISGSGSDERGGIRDVTSDEVGDGAAF